MQTRRDRPIPSLPVTALPTEHLLRLHERLFAPLDPKGTRRILRAASTGG